MVSLAMSAAMALPGSASASTPTPTSPAGHIGGVVPPHDAAHTSSSSGGASNLSYHNGPVMLSNHVYVIYWVPSGYSVSGNYESIINQFFTDVATASGSLSNVYATDNQYYNSSGTHIAYSSTFAGSTVDTHSLPASACSDSYTSVCLSDTQIQNEIRTVMSLKGWSATSTNFFVMLTAKGIGSCSGSSCAFSQYCAYHGSSAGLYYANMPYGDTVPSACDSNQYPNGDPAADSEINVLSHEHNETITDQQLNAWYDRRGYENGDKCAWNFGTPLGTTATGAEYNQSIGGHSYYLQQEWNNKSSGCALHA